MGNVAECAIAKSCSRHGGARQRYSELADNGKGNTASPKVIARHHVQAGKWPKRGFGRSPFPAAGEELLQNWLRHLIALVV